jgi:drug/metabolite transporter (DMT)-like permease
MQEKDSAKQSTAASQFIPAAAVTLCGIAWGAFWYPVRLLESAGAGGAWVSLILFAVATIAPLPWLFKRRLWQDNVASIMLTGFLLGTAFALYAISLVMTDVVRAILLFYMTPVWSTLADVVLYGRRLTPSRALSIGFGLFGLVAILGTAGGLPLPHTAGDWVALVSGMCWAAGTQRSHASPAHSLVLPVFAFSLCGMVSSMLILLVASGYDADLVRLDNAAEVVPWIILLALVVFVPPNFLVVWAAQRIDSARVGILLMTEVLAGSITAALWAGEPFGWREGLGATLIVCAGLVEVLPLRRR